MKNISLSIPGMGEVGTPPNIPSGVDAPNNIISTFLTLLILIGIVASLFFLLYGGILWITSGGDKQKLDRARHAITYSIVGLVIIVLAFTIVNLIGTLLGHEGLMRLGL